ERPAFVVLGTAIERAEAAVGDADVRVVDVPVDDVRDDALGMEGLPPTIGFGAELEERCVFKPIEEVFHRDGRRRMADGGWDGRRRMADGGWDDGRRMADILRRRKERETARRDLPGNGEASIELRESAQMRIAQAVVEAAEVFVARGERHAGVLVRLLRENVEVLQAP